MNHIEFPHLGLEFNIDPVALRLPFLGGGIRWYAIIILCGILAGSYFGFKEYKRLGQNPDNLYNILIWALPISIISARVYYIIFSPYEYESFFEMIKIWEGGIAIYGAVIGAAAVVIIYCRKHKLSLPLHFDIGAYGFMMGQAIGRWGNCVNGEAYGFGTNLLHGGRTGQYVLPWEMVVNGVSAHPTFLYESLWLFLGFIIIWNTRKIKSFEGRSGCFYLMWYGAERALVELLRTDSLMLGNIRISSLLSLLLVLVGAILYCKLKKTGDKSIKLS